MKSCIVNFATGGHHSFYISQVAHLDSVVGFVGNSSHLKYFLGKTCKFGVISNNSRLKLRSKKHQIQEYLKENRTSKRLFLMVADEMSSVIFLNLLLGRGSTIGGVTVSGIWFRSNFLYRKGIFAELKKRILLIFLTKWSSQSGLKYLDDHLASIIELRLGKRPGSLWCREPYSITKRAEAKDHLSEQATLLFVGEHAPRKGTAWAVETIANSEITPSQIRIKIIGRLLDKAVLPAILKARSRGFTIILNDQFVSSEEYEAAFKEADIVMLPYQDFGGSSGVLIEAAQFQRPFIATNAGTIGRIAGGESAVNTFSECSQREFISSIQDTLASYSKSDWVLQFDAILARCSLDEFQAHVEGTHT